MSHTSPKLCVSTFHHEQVPLDTHFITLSFSVLRRDLVPELISQVGPVFKRPSRQRCGLTMAPRLTNSGFQTVCSRHRPVNRLVELLRTPRSSWNLPGHYSVKRCRGDHGISDRFVGKDSRWSNLTVLAQKTDGFGWLLLRSWQYWKQSETQISQTVFGHCLRL